MPGSDRGPSKHQVQVPGCGPRVLGGRGRSSLTSLLLTILFWPRGEAWWARGLLFGGFYWAQHFMGWN